MDLRGHQGMGIKYGYKNKVTITSTGYRSTLTGRAPGEITSSEHKVNDHLQRTVYRSTYMTQPGPRNETGILAASKSTIRRFFLFPVSP